MIKYARQLLLYVAALFLAGCFSGKEDVQTFIDDIKKTSAGNINPLPVEKPKTNQEFTATDVRSPFVVAKRNDKIGSLTQIDGQQDTTTLEQAPRPDANRPREFLERFPLDNFTMVGTLSKEDYIWGLVRDNNGLVYPIKVGDYIGLNSGYVRSIDGSEINIEETVENGEGGWKHQMTKLVLQQAATTQKQGANSR